MFITDTQMQRARYAKETSTTTAAPWALDFSTLFPKTNCGLELFKRKLDEFLLQLPDQPQVPGYPRQYNNSLLDVITAYQRAQGGAFGLA